MRPRNLARGRRLAAELMSDQCLVERPDTGSMDPLTGEPIWRIVYAGRCKIQNYNPYETASPSGGVQVIIQQRFEVHLPIPAGRFDGGRRGDRVTITSSRSSPTLAGAVFSIQAPFDKTHSTAYRILIERDISNGVS